MGHVLNTNKQYQFDNCTDDFSAKSPRTDSSSAHPGMEYIHKSHENSGQVALLYITIILFIYFVTIAIFGIRYALKRSYHQTLLWRCCCFQNTNAELSSPTSDRVSRRRSKRGSNFTSVEIEHIAEITQTEEGLLETDL